MRLIDADRAMEIVRNQGIAHPHAYHLTNYAMLVLREAPTVDAVEVVSCKDCKFRSSWMMNRNLRYICPENGKEALTMAEYINRERARFEAKRYFKNMDEIQEDLDMLFCMLPAENVAPVRLGRWKTELDDLGWLTHTCTVCGYAKRTDIHVSLGWNHCPNCGAKMDGGAD